MTLNKKKLGAMLTVALLVSSIFVTSISTIMAEGLVIREDMVGDVNVNHPPLVKIIGYDTSPWLWAGDLFYINVEISDNNGLWDIAIPDINLKIDGVNRDFTIVDETILSDTEGTFRLEFIVPEKNRLHGNSTIICVTVTDGDGYTNKSYDDTIDTFFNPDLSFSVDGTIIFPPGDVDETVESNLRETPSYNSRMPLDWNFLHTTHKPIFLKYLYLNYGITWNDEENVTIVPDIYHATKSDMLYIHDSGASESVEIIANGSAISADIATIYRGNKKLGEIQMDESGNILYIPIHHWWAMSVRQESDVNIPMDLTIRAEDLIGTKNPDIFIDNGHIRMEQRSTNNLKSRFTSLDSIQRISITDRNEINFFHFRLTYPNVPKDVYSGHIFFTANWDI